MYVRVFLERRKEGGAKDCGKDKEGRQELYCFIVLKWYALRIK